MNYFRLSAWPVLTPFTAAAILALALVVGPAFTPSEAATAELTLGATPGPFALPVNVAREQGFFAVEGVQLRQVDCAAHPACVQALFDRRLQLVVATELTLALRSFERSDFAIVATIASATGNIRMIGRKSAGISESPQSLVGKRIGVLPGTSSQYYLDTFLYFHGVDPATVRIVELTPETVLTAFSANRIDALSAYTRHAGRVLAQLGDDAIGFADPRIYTETANLAVDRRTLAERGPEVAAVLRALQRAEIFIAAHPAEAKATFASTSKLERAYAETVYSHFTYRLTLDQSLLSTMDGVVRWARSSGLVASGAKSPNILELVDAKPLRQAVPSALPR